MARQANRNRSQTLSLRISPTVRFGLECCANIYKGSMTQVIERALMRLMASTDFDAPDYVESYNDDGKVTLSHIVKLTWHDDEVVRLLRLGLVAPRLLSDTERFIYEVYAGITKYRPNGQHGGDVSFLGQDDVFDGVHGLSDAYKRDGLRFDVEKCREHFHTLKADSEFLFVDPLTQGGSLDVEKPSDFGKFS